jgi:hypothetical protein
MRFPKPITRLDKLNKGRASRCKKAGWDARVAASEWSASPLSLAQALGGPADNAQSQIHLIVN